MKQEKFRMKQELLTANDQNGALTNCFEWQSECPGYVEQLMSRLKQRLSKIEQRLFRMGQGMFRMEQRMSRMKHHLTRMKQRIPEDNVKNETGMFKIEGKP